MKSFIKLLILAGLSAFGYYEYIHFRSNTQVTTILTRERIEYIGELASTTFHYREVGKFEKKNLPGGLDFLPFNISKLYVAYDGKIKIGVDFEHIQVNQDGQVVRVVVPPAKILSNEIDLKHPEILIEEEGFFAEALTSAESYQLGAQVKLQAEARAKKLNLLVQSQERCGQLVSEFLKPLLEEGMRVEVELSQL